MLRRRLSLLAASGLALTSNFCLANPASAHVKWFCAFDVAGQPRGLENVLCPDFELLTGVAILTLVGAYALDCSWVGAALTRGLNRATEFIRNHSETILRGGCIFFFIAIWTKSIILTPELVTQNETVSWLQLAIAACLLWRKTLPPAGAGIIGLYIYAVSVYGIFHLLDYPIFLGLAFYFILVGLNRDAFGVRALDILRWAAAITLLWASIEKWAYPQWTFPLLVTHPGMTLGLNPEFFMRAAGAVEFALAFALLLTPLVRRSAAAILCGMFIAAIPTFGKIDAIGHSAIIATLLAIIGDNSERFGLFGRSPTMADRLKDGLYPKWGRGLAILPIVYAVVLTAFLASYYLLHTALFGTKLT